MVINFSFEYNILYPLALIDQGYPEILEFKEAMTIEINSGHVVNLKNIWIAIDDNRIAIIDFIPIDLSKLILQLNTVFQSTFNDTYPPDSRFKDKVELEAFQEGLNYAGKELETIFTKNNIKFNNFVVNTLFKELDPDSPKLFN